MSKMKICLIDPLGGTKGLNVGLGYIASSLMENGYNVKVIDLNNKTNDMEHRLKCVKNYDVIGISIKSFLVENVSMIANILDRNDLICGGPHITIDGQNFIKENLSFNVGIVGEGEETFKNVVKVIEDGASFSDIDGIIYRQNDNIVVNRHNKLSNDLNNLFFPNYEVFDSFEGRILNYPIITSRGCPYSCIYCCVGNISGKKWRYRTPKNVIAELEVAKDKYYSESFQILDDNFTLNIRRTKEICDLLIKNNIDMKWSCPNGLRADCIDRQLVYSMKKSGCFEVSIGIESGSDKVFNSIKKGEKLEDIKRAIDILNESGISVKAFFIIGLPGDNPLHISESIQFSKSLKLSEAHWNLLVPYPGTEVWDWVNKDGAKILKDWKHGFHFGWPPETTFETTDFCSKDKIDMYKMSNTKSFNYTAFFDSSQSLMVNGVRIMGLILSYDLFNIHNHFIRSIGAMKKIRKLKNK